MKKFWMLLVAIAMLAPVMGCGEKEPDKEPVAPPVTDPADPTGTDADDPDTTTP
jgi:predicted small lipoprotein YifL